MESAIPQLILASASPRRKELLCSLGVPFSVVIPDIDETILPSESAQDMVRRLAYEKANAVATQYPSSWVIGSDTTVVIPTGDASTASGEVLAKPQDRAEAIVMLQKLQGRTHSVFTAFSLLCRETNYESGDLVETKVRFLHLSLDEIKAYVDTREPMDKAGAYGAQGIGGTFIESIVGSYTNVVGLPMAELFQHLRDAGVWKAHDLLNVKNDVRGTL